VKFSLFSLLVVTAYAAVIVASVTSASFVSFWVAFIAAINNQGAGFARHHTFLEIAIKAFYQPFTTPANCKASSP